MNDDMIQKLAANGGVIQINFGSTLLDGAIAEQRNGLRKKMMDLLKENGLTRKDKGGKLLIEQFQKDNPGLFSDVEKVADHIDHVVALTSTDHVGFGSDYDGVGDSLPTGLKDVSQFPNLIYVLLKRGYSETDIAKICYKNVFRVWSQVEQVASEMQKNNH